jgi:hypothetical protein
MNRHAMLIVWRVCGKIAPFARTNPRMDLPSKHTGTTAERKLPSRRLSVAPMMDWTKEAVCTEGAGAGL